MNAPYRRGACPGLSAPMQTGDGLLVRMRPIGTMAPAVAENARPFYRADVVNSLPSLAGITEMRDLSATAVDRSHPRRESTPPGR